MPMRKWFEQLFAPTNRRVRRAGGVRVRPRVEALECRVVPSAFTELEPNDTAATANAVVVPTGDILTATPADWLEISGTVTTGAPRDDFFKFTLSSRAGLFIDVDAQQGLTPASTLDSIVTVFDATGLTPLASNDDGYDFTSFAAPTTPAGGITAPNSKDSALYIDLQPGTYVIRMTGVGTTTGAYKLKLLADTNYTTTAPVFSSLPSATDTLYLDFDGGVGSFGTAVYSAGPFDLTGNSNEFSPAERLAIRNIWATVAEDYTPFNLNVTTVEPTGLTAFDDGVGFRQVITSTRAGDIDPMSDDSTPGLSLSGSYAANGANDNTGFTFARSFATNPNATPVDYYGDGGGFSGGVVAAALEMGNTSSRQFGRALGLNNYATSLAASRPQPTGTGEAVGASVIANAIMAIPDVGVNREVFASGTASDSASRTSATTSIQDDLGIIANTTNTIGLRPDDAGNTAATAATLGQKQPAVYLASGFIGDGDTDFYRFVATGDTTVTIDVDDYTGNLNAQVRLFTGDGKTLLASDLNNPTLDATVTQQNLPLGTYLIEVARAGTASRGEIGQYTVRITTGVNLLPVASTSAGASSYLVNNPPVPVDPGLTLSDFDSTQLLGATVQITGGYVKGQDVLALPDGSGLLSFFDANAGTLTLFGTASLAAYQAALRTVTFANTGATPATSVRTISFRGVDNNGPGAPAARALVVGNAPVIGTSPGSTAFISGGPAVAVDAQLALTDPDSPNLTGATVRFATGYVLGQDVLAFTPADGITGAFDASTGTLALSGSAPQAAYQAALRSITYRNTSTGPTLGARGVTFTATDGISFGPAVTKTVVVVPTNLVPVNTVPAGPLTVAEGGTVVVTGVSVADPAATTIQVTLSVGRGTLLVNPAVAGGLTVAQVSGNGTGTVVLLGPLAAVNVTLANGFQYTPLPNTNGADTLTVFTSDLGGAGPVGGAILTDTDTVAINVTAVNAPPVAGAVALPAVAVGSGPLLIPFTALLANANPGPNEADQTLTVTAVGGATGGTVAIVNGAVQFTPADGFSGIAGFTFTVQDNGQTNGVADPKTATGTAQFRIGDPPAPPAPAPASPPVATGGAVSGGAVVISKADGSAATFSFQGTGLTPSAAFAVADFNGGGGVDVAVLATSAAGRPIVMLIDGVTNRPYAAIGDLNGDGVAGDVVLQVPAFSAAQGAPADAVFFVDARTGRVTRLG